MNAGTRQDVLEHLEAALELLSHEGNDGHTKIRFDRRRQAMTAINQLENVLEVVSDTAEVEEEEERAE